MRAGRLRHKVRLEAKGAHNLNSSGQPRDTWVVEGQARAEVRPLGAVERQEAERKHGECTHQITIRGRHLLPTPAKRFVWYDHRVERDRVFEIVGVIDFDELGVELRNVCKEAQ